MSLDPEDFDPLDRLGPRPAQPQDPENKIGADLAALLRQVIVRVEQLEKDMRLVKEKLQL